MSTQNTNTTTQEAVYVDTVAQDFRAALLIVSLGINLTIFVAWLTILVA